MILLPIVKQAYDLATIGLHRAYAPYSQFRVGAAIKVVGTADLVFACNVENISLGATICAERNAINQMIARFGTSTPQISREKINSNLTIAKPINIEFVVVVADTQIPTMPCGMCLQCLSEFSNEGTSVYIGNLEKVFGQYKLSQLLPNPYHNI